MLQIRSRTSAEIYGAVQVMAVASLSNPSCDPSCEFRVEGSSRRAKCSPIQSDQVLPHRECCHTGNAATQGMLPDL
eukprot:356357-Chlamydomonas_euryale.AAC.6